jgi:hypothetical protein
LVIWQVSWICAIIWQSFKSQRNCFLYHLSLTAWNEHWSVSSLSSLVEDPFADTETLKILLMLKIKFEVEPIASVLPSTFSQKYSSINHKAWSSHSSDYRSFFLSRKIIFTFHSPYIWWDIWVVFEDSPEYHTFLDGPRKASRMTLRRQFSWPRDNIWCGATCPISRTWDEESE